ncbi:hypothetical protein HDU76_001531 [Blyttiomyces sp. JEL0837]|nr:hypothetical protein HDU76_001531 [Blyttiomyces sp. JEL0837]
MMGTVKKIIADMQGGPSRSVNESNVLHVAFLIDITGSIEYVQKQLKLSCPPGLGISASGEDGPENVVASVANLTKVFQSNENILAFVISDSNPHHKVTCLNSPTAKKEKEWLRDNGFETDPFVVLNDVIDTVNVTFVPILYGRPDSLWYTQAATMTGGVVLYPNASSSQVLAKGLEALMLTLTKVSSDGNNRQPPTIDAATLTALQGFRVVCLTEDEFTPLDAEPETRDGISNGRYNMASRSDDMGTALRSLLATSVDRFSGKKALKRVKGVDVEKVTENVSLLIWGMVKAVGRTDLFDMAGFHNLKKKLLDEEVKDGDEADKKLVKRVLELIDGKALDLKQSDKVVDESVQCVVTLETAVETLAELKKIPSCLDDLKQWIELVMQLCMVRLVDVRFPRDKLNPAKVDFADAWTAAVTSVSTASVMSAYAATQIRSDRMDDDGQVCYKDPFSARDYSTALILAHPNDPVLTRAYHILTGLPQLNGLIQGNLVSGGFSIFPSLGPGLQSASLLFLLRQTVEDAFKKGVHNVDSITMTKATWEVVRCLVWSLQNSMATPCPGLVADLRDGKGFNPADPITKLMAALIVHLSRCWKTTAPMLLLKETRKLSVALFEEMAGGAMSSFITMNNRRVADGKEKTYKGFVTPENLAGCFLSDTQIPSVEDDGAKFDPITSLHESETFVKGDSDPADGWMERLESVVGETAIFKNIFAIHTLFAKVVDASFTDLGNSDPDTATVNKKNDGSSMMLLDVNVARKIMAESAILGGRSIRYKQVEATTDGVSTTTTASTPIQWSRLDSTDPALDIIKLGRDLASTAYATNFRTWNHIRDEKAHTILVQQFAKFAQSLDANKLVETNLDESLTPGLKEITVKIHSKVYTLTRADVVDLLQHVPKSLLPTLGIHLIDSTWTSEHPQGLRRHLTYILSVFKEIDTDDTLCTRIMKAVRSAALCCREEPNRHGHTVDLQFPGPLGWTLEYEEQRLKNLGGAEFTKVEKVKRILKWMKECTESGIVMQLGRAGKGRG